MKISRREALITSGAGLAGMSLAATTSAIAQAPSPKPLEWPDRLADRAPQAGLSRPLAAQPRWLGPGASGERGGTHRRAADVAHTGSPAPGDGVRLSEDGDQGGYARAGTASRHAPLLRSGETAPSVSHIPDAVWRGSTAWCCEMDWCPIRGFCGHARACARRPLLPPHRLRSPLRRRIGGNFAPSTGHAGVDDERRGHCAGPRCASAPRRPVPLRESEHQGDYGNTLLHAGPSQDVAAGLTEVTGYRIGRRLQDRGGPS